MNFLESILFLILSVGFGAGIPLMWYIKQVSKKGKKQIQVINRAKFEYIAIGVFASRRR